MDINRFRKSFDGKEHAYVPLDESDELIVVMSAFGIGNKFMHLKTMLSDQRTNLLFIADPNYTWYLEKDMGESFSRLINEYASKFDNNKVTLVGTSMSGYGALYHGVKFGFNIISSNPQINLKVSLNTIPIHWGPNLRQTEFIDISTIMSGRYIKSCIYILFGHSAVDIANLKEYSKIITKSVKQIVEIVDSKKHSYYFKDVDRIYERMAILNHLSKMQITEVEHPGVVD